MMSIFDHTTEKKALEKIEEADMPESIKNSKRRKGKRKRNNKKNEKEIWR
ncbi:MAG: hypothetical protein LBV17_10165 [Treponema sp.]|jgi:hypothetical protein|nr:hypothetical protein [Treponema sp.]